eukprot:934361-Pyramimonas_sp.AAC.1
MKALQEKDAPAPKNGAKSPRRAFLDKERSEVHRNVLKEGPCGLQILRGPRMREGRAAGMCP